MIRADEYPTKDANETLAVSFFTTLMVKDWDAFSNLWTEDAVWVMPFAPEVEGLAPAFHGRQEITDIHRAAGPARQNYVFRIENLDRTQDPNRIIIEATAHSTNPVTRLDYDQNYIFVYTIEGEKIRHLRVYCDPRIYEKAFKEAPTPYG